MVRVALVFLLVLGGCKKPPKPYAPKAPTTLADGVVVQQLREGNEGGDVAKKGDKITIHFVGTLADGGVFDSSRKRDAPLGFWVGEGYVVKGLDEGLLGMTEGEVRRVTVPAALGYGSSEQPKIPANSELTFEVELLNVR